MNTEYLFTGEYFYVALWSALVYAIGYGAGKWDSRVKRRNRNATYGKKGGGKMDTSAIGPVGELSREDLEKTALAEVDWRAVHTLEVAVNEQGVRFKFNGYIWSPPVGRLVAR